MAINITKLKKICRPIRIVVGLILILTGLITGISWFYLGIIPLIAGITNFCFLGLFSKKCELPQE